MKQPSVIATLSRGSWVQFHAISIIMTMSLVENLTIAGSDTRMRQNVLQILQQTIKTTCLSKDCDFAKNILKF